MSKTLQIIDYKSGNTIVLDMKEFTFPRIGEYYFIEKCIWYVENVDSKAYFLFNE